MLDLRKLDRRQFGSLAAGCIGGLLTQKLWAEQVRPSASQDKFYFALIADSHIIDNFYVKGGENGVEDNESILVTTPRLIAARDLINSLKPAIEQVFLIGDYFHNYPSTDYDFYFKNTTRLDNAKAITDAFKMPVHLGFGNHDYDVHHVPREMSHRLFAAKFEARPYSSLDYKGFKFVHLNNFLGSTQDHSAADFNPGIGSLGQEQLNCLSLSSDSINRPSSSFTSRCCSIVQRNLPTSDSTRCFASIKTQFNLSSPVICTNGSISPTPMVRNITSWPPHATIPTLTC